MIAIKNGIQNSETKIKMKSTREKEIGGHFCIKVLNSAKSLKLTLIHRYKTNKGKNSQ